MPTTVNSSSAPPIGVVTALDGALFAFLILVDSLHLVFARAFLPYFEPVHSATLVLSVGTLIVGLYGFFRGEIHLSSLATHWKFYVSVGFLVGASTAMSYSAIAYIDAGSASMLAKISTLFSICIGIWWLHEKLHRIQIFGAVLALLGIVLISFQPGEIVRLGVLLILISSLMYAFHTALVKRHGNAMGFLDFFFFRLLFTSLTLGLISLTRPVTVETPNSIWLLILVAAIVDIVISRSLYYLALRRLPLSLHAIILTLSPVVTLAWAFLLFDTFPAPMQLLGGATVIVGVSLAAYVRAS